MPRPRVATLSVDGDRIRALYADGHSTRRIAALTGLTRWRVERHLERANVRRRDRLDTDALRAYRSDHLPRCAWPGCGTRLAGGGLCPDHTAEVEELAGERECAWPTGWFRWCGQRARDGLCSYHWKRATGVTSGAT